LLHAEVLVPDMSKTSLIATWYLRRSRGEDWEEARRDATAANEQANTWAAWSRGVKLHYINGELSRKPESLHE
jgi:hypothetical protein